MSIYTLHAQPELDSPVLVVLLEGWIDAGLAVERAREVMLDQMETTHVATFDADALLDFRARRPTMHLVDGVNTGLTWPATELHAATDPSGKDLLLLTGVEPDHAWRSFCGAVREVAVDFGCRMQVGLGAYPAGAPHSRPVVLSATASTDELAGEIGFLRGTIDVPAGIEAAIEESFDEVGIPAVGIWAQVPHYAATMRYPAASVALIGALNRVAGTDFSTISMADDIGETREKIDRLISGNHDHLEMLRQLEEQVDAVAEEAIENLPSGDDLAEELQKFLREQGDS